MSLGRRDFLGLAAASSATLLGGKSLANEQQLPRDCKDACAVLVDTAVCIGCRKCEWACNKQHNLSEQDMAAFEDKSIFATHRRPTDQAYTVVNEFRDPAKPDKQYTIKVQCMHCLDPACVSACIVGALEKLPNGPVVYDAWKCMGCRYCIVACPFQVPAYEYENALTPQVRKCTFCTERKLEEGNVPACVEACPNEALTFGARDDLIDLAHARIKAHPDRYVDHVYGEHEAGGTSFMYLAPTDFNNTELPDIPDDPIPPNTENIQHAIFKWFVPPLALYGLLGLIMASKPDKVKEQEGHE